mgnify:CR=1 FL=1
MHLRKQKSVADEALAKDVTEMKYRSIFDQNEHMDDLEQDVSAKAGKQGVKTLSAADGSQLQDSDGSYLHSLRREINWK